MAIPETDIIRLSTPPMTRAESVYLPEVVKGFGTTMRHFFTSFGQSRTLVHRALGLKKTSRTLQYPEERREHFTPEQGGLEPSNFRGVHRLNKDEDGRVRCVACMMCPTICPANCIHITAAESPFEAETSK